MSDNNVIQIIKDRDQQRTQALLDGNIDQVETYLGSSLRYIHTSGTDEDLALYLKKLRDGFYKYIALEASHQDYRQFADTVIVNGKIHVHVIAGGNDKDFDALYTQIWVVENNEWKMVSWQTTLAPNP
ncbi:MAG: nuclear transport factor 2 family protein [Pseudomonadota bacterium]